jgi:hypothetical protein
MMSQTKLRFNLLCVMVLGVICQHYMIVIVPALMHPVVQAGLWPFLMARQADMSILWQDEGDLNLYQHRRTHAKPIP